MVIAGKRALSRFTGTREAAASTSSSAICSIWLGSSMTSSIGSVDEKILTDRISFVILSFRQTGTLMTLTPFEPGNTRKIVAVHLNYPSRAAQRGRTPAYPTYFLKPTSSMSATGGSIERPAGTELLAFEGEIALIIGTTTRRVSPEEGRAAVSGITASNDFGVYDLRLVDKGSNVKSKAGDGFTPIGPDVIP